MWPAIVIGILAALPVITWPLYLAIMSLGRARDAGNLPKSAERLGKILLAVGYLFDFALNMTVGTLLFMEFPKEYLLSPRVTRLKNTSSGYRQKVAAWICVNLLDPFDPSGCHCKQPE